MKNTRVSPDDAATLLDDCVRQCLETSEQMDDRVARIFSDKFSLKV
jgi:hypothetical protein